MALRVAAAARRRTTSVGRLTSASSAGRCTPRTSSSTTTVTRSVCARTPAFTAPRSSVRRTLAWTCSIRTVCGGNRNRPPSERSPLAAVRNGCGALTTGRASSRVSRLRTGRRFRAT
uniref:(northern house mosquito) hypothetical protein n=1 Tax=Culex pipiens TaxID=7175 RepID=A0A8D8JD93_CULPI